MSNIMIFDGAMGTMLQQAGLPAGARTDVYGMQHPDIVEDIHRQYIAAGSRIIESDTFGTNARKLKGSGFSVSEVVSANVTAARKAAGGLAKVALSIGPIGDLMEPLGTLSFQEAYDIYKEIVVAGEAAGADIVIFETQTSLAELRAGVLAATENTELPVWTTMSFEKSGKTFAGTDCRSFAACMDGLPVQALGVNCSLGPTEILPILREMRKWTAKPLIAKPNAGLPDPESGEYTLTAEAFAQEMRPVLELGVSVAGGCCGTSPEYIRCLEKVAMEVEGPAAAGTGESRAAQGCEAGDSTFTEAEGTGCAGRAEAAVGHEGAETRDSTFSEAEDCAGHAGQAEAAVGHEGTCEKNSAKKTGVCSAGKAVEFAGIKCIGERINPTGKKRFQQALRENDLNYIMKCALDQEQAGADILDINVGIPGIDEPAVMESVVKAVSNICSLPLQIDSSNAEAIEAGLRAFPGKAIVNSVDGDDETLERVLPIVRKYGAAVVGLTMDKNGIPRTAEDRVRIAHKIVSRAESYGISRENVIIDCLTLTVSAEQEQARETLEAVRRVRSELGVHCTLGISNISFGLPSRVNVTRAFLAQAIFAGVDIPIVNPNQTEIMDTIFSCRAILGDDPSCMNYIERFTAQAGNAASGGMAAGNAVPGGTASDSAAGNAPGSTAGGAAQEGTGTVPNAGTGQLGGGAAKNDVQTGSGKNSAPGTTAGKPLANHSGVNNGSAEMTIEYAVSKGLGEEVARLTEELLETRDCMDIINGELIPALDVVGDKFERGEFFLPQLINAANAAGAGFDVVKARIAAQGGGTVGKGPVILATVEGDIHDIGKNIVKVVLENYGYKVIDLGKSVPATDVVSAAIRENARIVGLSALMTTTVDAMRKTIEALRAAGCQCKVVVGGAVLTPEYARKIGADYYAKDAKATVDAAREVIG